MSASPALEMKGITKIFPGVKALSEVSLTVHFGTIHAIVGENGAGKSTLMKILNGLYAPTEGAICINGEPVNLKDPADAQARGIRMVHQEINLADDLTVSENVHLGRMPRRGPFVDQRVMDKQTADVLARLGARIDPRHRLGDLTVSQQQLVEIAKAYAAKPRIIVLDEPTSSLSEHEAGILFNVLKTMRDEGLAIIYISHRLREVMEIADEVTVLRDGALVETRPVAGMTPTDMIQSMVGRTVSDLFPKHDADIGAPVLGVKGLSDGIVFSDVSFEVKAGEIVGLTGLVGAGRTEVARAIFGLSYRSAGEILLEGERINPRSPADAMRAGIAYVPEDRKADGIVSGLSIRENFALPILGRIARYGFTRPRAETRLTKSYIERFGIVPPDPSRRIVSLSGGNQQKVTLAKWIASNPRVLILDEPTRGVDVGAKAEIHAIIGELVAQGLAVLMISSELTEVISVSDRVYVMHEGKISAPLSRDQLSEHRIMELATGESGALGQEVRQ